jgi:type IV secretion system protein VirD4
VRLLLDEFANIGKIPDFDKIIATVRSREISVTVILQNLAQIKSMYRESWESITGNADSLLFLGGSEQSTLEYMSKAMGKQTIYLKTHGLTRGKNRSSSINESITGRALMTHDEIGNLPDEKCILLIKGIRPFLSNKFKIEKHKNYKLLGEDGVNEFDYKDIKTEVFDYEFDERDIDFTEEDTNYIEYEPEHEDDFDDEAVNEIDENNLDLDEYYEKQYAKLK